LGGVDFDSAISNLICNKTSRNNYDPVLLRNVSEKAKKMLSHMQTANVMIEKDSVKISREEFESSILSYVDKTLSCVNDALRDANTKTNMIDEIVFVGGSTRIPLIEKVIEEKFGKKPNKSINPDEAVSIGAAIQASVLSGNSSKEVYLIDVTPLSLGIETQGGIMTILMPRNTQIPAVVKEIFTTAFDNQTEVDVKVYQGERPKTLDNLSLGQFRLDDIIPKPRGVPKIEVTFSVDANGILSVKAKDEQSETFKEIQITGQASLSSEEIKRILDEAIIHKDEDENLRSLTNKHDLLYDYMIQIEELLRTNVLSSDDENDLIDLKKSIEQDGKSHNLELLGSLIENCRDTIKEKSHIIHDIAKKKVEL
jgi:molecular chaperone DnaK